MEMNINIDEHKRIKSTNKGQKHKKCSDKKFKDGNKKFTNFQNRLQTGKLLL